MLQRDSSLFRCPLGQVAGRQRADLVDRRLRQPALVDGPIKQHANRLDKPRGRAVTTVGYGVSEGDDFAPGYRFVSSMTYWSQLAQIGGSICLGAFGKGSPSWGFLISPHQRFDAVA